MVLEIPKGHPTLSTWQSGDPLLRSSEETSYRSWGGIVRGFRHFRADHKLRPLGRWAAREPPNLAGDSGLSHHPLPMTGYIYATFVNPGQRDDDLARQSRESRSAPALVHSIQRSLEGFEAVPQ